VSIVATIAVRAAETENREELNAGNTQNCKTRASRKNVLKGQELSGFEKNVLGNNREDVWIEL